MNNKEVNWYFYFVVCYLHVFGYLGMLLFIPMPSFAIAAFVFLMIVSGVLGILSYIRARK